MAYGIRAWFFSLSKRDRSATRPAPRSNDRNSVTKRHASMNTDTTHNTQNLPLIPAPDEPRHQCPQRPRHHAPFPCRKHVFYFMLAPFSPALRFNKKVEAHGAKNVQAPIPKGVDLKMRAARKKSKEPPHKKTMHPEQKEGRAPGQKKEVQAPSPKRVDFKKAARPKEVHSTNTQEIQAPSQSRKNGDHPHQKEVQAPIPKGAD